MANWLKKYQVGGYPQPTHNDSLALYYNALDKERFYKNSLIYTKATPFTDFSDADVRRELYDEIPDFKDDEIDPRQVKVFNASNRFLGEKRFKDVPNTGLRQAGDILDSTLDVWFNPEAPPIYIHPHISPQGSESYHTEGLTDRDVSDVPHYDPLAILNYSYLTPEQRRRRLAKYGDKSFPRNYDINKDETKPIPPNPATQPRQQPQQQLTREQRYELYKKTPQYAENIKKQQELIDAGFDIKLDGFWGKESQAAYEELQKRVDKLPIKEIPLTTDTPKNILPSKDSKPSIRFRQYTDPYGGVDGRATARVMGAKQQRELEKAKFRGLPEPELIPELQEEATGRYLKWDNPKDAMNMYQWYLNNGYTGEEEFLKANRPLYMNEGYINHLANMLRSRNTSPIDNKLQDKPNFKDGGIKTATTPKERYVGLNDNRYDQMFFPSKGFNTFRGLDSRQPVSLIDENGKRVVLYDPLQTVEMFGNVHEQRMEQGGVKKGWLDKYSTV